jgi:hypothetical protein
MLCLFSIVIVHFQNGMSLRTQRERVINFLYCILPFLQKASVFLSVMSDISSLSNFMHLRIGEEPTCRVEHQTPNLALKYFIVSKVTK